MVGPRSADEMIARWRARHRHKGQGVGILGVYGEDGLGDSVYARPVKGISRLISLIQLPFYSSLYSLTCHAAGDHTGVVSPHQ